MATKLGTITRKRARINCDFGGGTFFIEIDPSKFTSKWIEAATELAPAQRNCEIANLVLAWDLVDEDEKELPITPETFMDFPIELVNYLWAKMIEANSPGK